MSDQLKIITQQRRTRMFALSVGIATWLLLSAFLAFLGSTQAAVAVNASGALFVFAAAYWAIVPAREHIMVLAEEIAERGSPEGMWTLLEILNDRDPVVKREVSKKAREFVSHWNTEFIKAWNDAQVSSFVEKLSISDEAVHVFVPIIQRNKDERFALGLQILADRSLNRRTRQEILEYLKSVRDKTR